MEMEIKMQFTKSVLCLQVSTVVSKKDGGHFYNLLPCTIQMIQNHVLFL